MWSNGGDESKLDTPEVAEALDYWKALLKDGSLSKSTVNWTQADVNDQFMAGNAAMMINGPWQVETLNARKGLNWGIAEIPVPEAGDDSVGPLGGGVLTVPNTGDTEREKKAAEIIGCMAGEQEQITYALNSWMVPANSKAAAVWRTKAPELAALALPGLDGPLAHREGRRPVVVRVARPAERLPVRAHRRVQRGRSEACPAAGHERELR